MQASKRQRGEHRFSIIEDPIRNRWLLFYFNLGLECDVPILEPIWAQVSQQLLLLMRPADVIEEFLNRLPKNFTTTSFEEREMHFGYQSAAMACRWVCTFTPHGSMSRTATESAPEIAFDFGTCMDPEHPIYSRLMAFDVTPAGCTFSKYISTFKTHIETFASLEVMMDNMQKLTNKTMEIMKNLNG